MSDVRSQQPVTVESETGSRNGMRFHRYRLSPMFWVTVFEDGRVLVSSYDHDLYVTNVSNYHDGSSVSVEPFRKFHLKGDD